MAAGFVCGGLLFSTFALHAELSSLEARLERRQPAVVDCPAPAETPLSTTGGTGRP
jgi:hypothetical protein